MLVLGGSIDRRLQWLVCIAGDARYVRNHLQMKGPNNILDSLLRIDKRTLLELPKA